MPIASAFLFTALLGGHSSAAFGETAIRSAVTSAASGSTPYNNTGISVPGTFEAEDFDLGGEGTAYHDNVRGNAGGRYRSGEDVDIVPSLDAAGGRFDVNNFETGEWLTYTIEVSEAAQYEIELRAASAFSGSAFHIEVDGQDVSGRVTVPNTGSWAKYVWVKAPDMVLGSGTHRVTIVSEQQYFNLNSVRTAAAPVATPYYGEPAAVPGNVEAEDFDRGGEGLAYHDRESGNAGGQYRRSEDVDIVPTGDAGGGGYDVNNFQTGEWLGYSIDVAEDGDYDIELRATSAFADSAFRAEIDGRDVSGRVAVGDTGGWRNFKWVGVSGVPLAAGAHTLRIVAVQQYFNFNRVRMAQTAGNEPVSEPFNGTPAAVPGYIEAEDFDLGGEGLAYHDIVRGNAGGRYRPDEDVDIVRTGDANGGDYDVNNIQTGEWLSYTVDVADSGDYNIELRVASAFTDSAFRIEIDGRDVTGGISVPNTGNWTAFEWAGKQGVSLSAGRHVLKVVSERQYFNLNAIRVNDASAPTPDSSAKLLFSSGFDGATNLLPPVDCWGRGCWQSIAGLDNITNFSWPSTLWNGTSRFLLLTDPVITTPLTIGNYTFNRIESTSGPRGNASNALFQQITKNVNGTAPMGTSPAQNELEFQPKTDVSDLYVSFWIKLQPDLVEKMNNLPPGPGISGGGTWRAFFAMKTGNQTAWGDPAGDGDYRIEAYVMTYGGGQPYWALNGDNTAGGGAPLVNHFSVQNRDVPVPVGQWFKFEIFWHRSNASDGRVWMAVDGQVVADRRGPNTGAWDLPVNRIMAPLLYSGGRMPIYQWIDNIEIWDGFPPTGSNPPYGAH